MRCTRVQVVRKEYVDSVVAALDSRGKGRLDLVEARTLLAKMQVGAGADA